jgi:putative transcriptional regulator
MTKLMRQRQVTKRAALDTLLANVRQATELARLTRAPGRNLQINAVTIKQLRSWTKLSQPAFAALLGVELSTLRNWEQGRREPAGPARALLRAIHNDPESVIRALEPSASGPRRPPLRRAAA